MIDEVAVLQHHQHSAYDSLLRKRCIYYGVEPLLEVHAPLRRVICECKHSKQDECRNDFGTRAEDPDFHWNVERNSIPMVMG